MASVAESSIASVPLSKLAQLQENLLQPEPKNDVQASGTDTTNTNNTEAVVPESANAYNTPKSSPKAPPRLSASQSAPASRMETMINISPSQELFTAMTRASSFHGYPGGDTQPMESQVYRDFTESMAKSTTTTPKKAVLTVQISPDGKATYDTETTDKTPHTCIDGGTGYVDLENAWQPASPGAQSESSHVDELLRSPATQLQIDGSAPRPMLPETPSVAGNKHGGDGEILTSVTTTHKKTPGFTQLFGGGNQGAILSATQLFNQTQAPSSPMPDGPRSDPIATRPSPNLQHQYGISSPTILASSPIMTMHGRPSSAIGEPRNNYTSMKESQERRAARLRQELGLQNQFPEDMLEEDEDDDIEQRRFQHKRMHRVKSDQALHEWERVRAPSRPGSRPTSSPKQRTTIDLVTPATEKKTDVDFDVSDDGHTGDGDVNVENELPDEREPSDDEYDELGQTVLRSQSNDHDIEEENESTTGDVEAEDPRRSNQGHDPCPPFEAPQEDDGQDLHAREGRHTSGTQRSAVADSQPLQQTTSRSLLPQQTTEQSSAPSFVPGSQHVGTMSQGRSVIRFNDSRDSKRGKPSSTMHTQERRVPSSPPLVPVGDRGADAATSTSNLRIHTETSAGKELEVPESDLPGSDGVMQPSSSQVGAVEEGERESNPNLLFSTARTHVSASGPSPQKNGYVASQRRAVVSQQSISVSQSPRTAAGVRRFAEIAAASSAPRASGETEVDIDAIMSDVITADDEEFIKVVSDPPRERVVKRRKITHSNFNSNANNLSSASPSPAKHARIEMPPEPSHGQLDAIAQPVFTATADVASRRSTNALQDSPSKANELRPANSLQCGSPESTTDSVRLREEAGAKAASQLLSSRRSKMVKPAVTRTSAKSKLPTPLTKGVARPAEDRDGLVTNNLIIQETNEVDGDRGIDAPDKSDSADLVAISNGPTVNAPNRVLALFKGSFNNFYPATWLGSSPDGLKQRVQFDDTTITPIETQHVRRLDLRVGDTIKVDRPGMRKGTWLINGLGHVAQDDEERAAGTDVYGRISVHVGAKSNRTSIATERLDIKDKQSTTEVPIWQLYLTHGMWSHFADREFIPLIKGTTVPSRTATPSSGARTPDPDTSASRSRRAILPTAKAVAAGRTSHLREESVVCSSQTSTAGLFSGMAFAISYGSNEAEKTDVSRMIIRNGGVILENGFDELFSLPNLDEAVATSPSKRSARKIDEPGEEQTGLCLRPEYESFGFVALIADRHSRRAKYVQALALGLPTLSGRWIADSLDISKNLCMTSVGAVPLPWAKYLLPAGESAYLGGAVRSRTMSIYAADKAKLSTTIEERDILLNDDGVLIVAPKKSKATWERRKAYAFLTLALGAGCVKRVSDLEEAKLFVADDPAKWKWVYVDGSVADASATMFGKSSGGGKKRKRDEEHLKIDAKAMSAGNGTVMIVNDEFVVQSLILGALVD
ncbi:radiation sensitive protein rad9 [Vermiconidia calcicola]|uniref:Radiation sensitive protein rad9 n=1 Tax=Vermiconidia calcicola TaxID=1690605 RepID=A0ACC3MFA7_9PEZI|nr:radiation sensitive protein rad9 [Vermiconidia calcicola]